MADDVKIIELDPATWLHKEGTSRSALLRPEDGKMCCMGVMCVAYGMPKSAIRNIEALDLKVREQLPEKVKAWAYRAADNGGAKSTLSAMYHLNDWGKLDDPPDDEEETGFGARHHAEMERYFASTTDEEVVNDLNSYLTATDAPFRFKLKE